MNRTLLRAFVALMVAAICALVVPATSNAQPALKLQPGRSDAVAITKGVGYRVNVNGLDISYRVTGVPLSVNRPPITLPGSCTTVVIDAAKAAPYLPELINGGDVDLVELINDLIQKGVVAQFHLLRVASGGVVTGTFSNLPIGAYIVASVCNANTNYYGAALVAVLSPALSMGSSDNGSTAGTTGQGSSGNGSTIGTPPAN